MHTFYLLLILLASSFSFAANYEGLIGARIGVGAAAYIGGADNKDNADAKGPSDVQNPLKNMTEFLTLGLGIPIQAEFTYSPTNALELFIGAKYTPSFSLWSRASGVTTTARTRMPLLIGPVLGLRYYTNTQEAVRGYFSPQIAIAVNEFWVAEIQANTGLQWDVMEWMALYFQAGMGFTAFVGNYNTIGTGAQISPNVAIGTHFHF
jgi:hypothetical protein